HRLWGGPAAAAPSPRVWRRGDSVACARAGWRRGPRGRAGAHRRTRRSALSWCRLCVPHPCAVSFQPSLLGVPVEERPLWPVGGVGDLDARFLEPVADRVGLCPVAYSPSLVAALHLRLHEDVDSCHGGRGLV